MLGRAASIVDVCAELMLSCAPHAEQLGCADELKLVADLLVHGGPERQRRLAERDGLVADLAADFLGGATRADRDVVA